jgi:hypothetical protein
MKTLLTLFDYSGAWAQPFADNGWNVIQWDIKIEEFMDINLLDSAETVLDLFEDVDGIIAAPPCTDFASSGAQYWGKKDAAGTTEKAMEYVRQVLRLADLFRPTDPDYFEEDEENVFFWAMENPVGRMNTLFPELEKPYYFNPSDFAGYLDITAADLQRLDVLRAKNGEGITAEENEFIIRANAYTKKTGLWGEFNRNMERRVIQPVKSCKQGSFTQRLGGNNAATKEARSNTPEGFALAFYQANFNHQVEI